MRTFARMLERFARHAVVYPFLRLFLHNQPAPLPIDIRKVRKILILRYDRIGDIVVTTPIFRLLKKANPNLFVAVLASSSNAELISHNRHVDRIHVLHSNWFSLAKEIVSAHNEHYDVVLNFIFNRTTSGGVLANCVAPRGIKIGQGDEKYRFYFNVLLKLSRGSRHMAEVLGDIVKEVFGIALSHHDLVFEIPSEKRISEVVDGFLKERKLIGAGMSERYVVFNISATDAVRRISDAQAKSILSILTDELKLNTVVISAPLDEEWRMRLVQDAGTGHCWTYPATGTASLLEIVALIKKAKAVVTPDTAVVHLASASKTPVIGLFTPLQVAAEWFPYNVKHRIVMAGEGLTVSSIPVDVMRTELRTFLKGRK